VDPEPDTVVLAPGGDGVVEVARVRRVDGEGGQVAEICPPIGAYRLGRRLQRLELDLLRERAPQPAVEHQALEDVAGHIGAAERAQHPRAALARAHQHQVALARAPAVERDGRRPVKERLGHLEAPPAGDGGHQRRIEPADRAAARRRPRLRAHFPSGEAQAGCLRRSAARASWPERSPSVSAERRPLNASRA